MSGRILLWPVVPRRPAGVDLALQDLLPSADRGNITELWRWRCDREYEAMVVAMRETIALERSTPSWQRQDPEVS